MNLLETKNIKIGDKDYPVKMSLRAMVNFEKISGHSVSQVETLEDIIIMFYCTAKAGGCELTYDQFMDLIDDKPESLRAFSDIMMDKSEKKAKAR